MDPDSTAVSMDLAQTSPDATLIDLDDSQTDDFLFTGEQGTETPAASTTSQVSTAEQALRSAPSPDRVSSSENPVTVDDDVEESPQY